MRRLLLAAVALLLPCSLAVAAPPQHASLAVSHGSQVSAVAATPAPTPRPNTLPLTSLLAVSLLGATQASDSDKPAAKKSGTKSRSLNLSRPYLWKGTTYGPGRNISVPEGFPDLDDKGDVIHEEGTTAAANQARVRAMASPPSTGGVNTGEGQGGAAATVSGVPRAQLEDMKKDELKALAAEKNITVTRSDGEDGEPLVDDYIDALSKTS